MIRQIILLLLSCSIQLAYLEGSRANIPLSEYNALYDLYVSAGGSNWDWNPELGVQWDFENANANPCADRWQGLNCTRFDPSENITHIGSINLKGCKLVGTLPYSLTNVTFLRSLNLNDNELSGDVPGFLGELFYLEIIAFNKNNFGGTLPSSYGYLTGLLLLDVYKNHVAGSIPDSYTNLFNLEYFDVYDNDVTGTIPAFFSNFRDLKYLYLGKNRFVGTLPTFENLTNALFLYVNDNYLTGTVPISLSQLGSLESLFLQGNKFTGSLHGVFNSTVQTSLTIALFSDNRFTGQIPNELFRLPKLKTVGGGSNCMVGTLPLTICNSSSLQTLALDGMATSESCRHLFFPQWSESYKVDQALTGGIPTCIYQLPLLQILHLSSNGLNGRLPSRVDFAPTFRDFGVSHNSLTGTIPNIFQTRRWSNLDLSFNRITGELQSDWAPLGPNASLVLRDNRLSGEIPSTIDDSTTASISVLAGNVFTCAIMGDDLPEQDAASSSYICGSNMFIVYYSIWMFGAAIALIYCIYTFKPPAAGFGNKSILLKAAWNAVYEFFDYCLTPADIFSGIDPSRKKDLYRVYKIYLLCGMKMRVAFVVTLAICTLMIFYGVTSNTSSTLSNQYAYKVSLIFTTGIVSFALGMALLVLLLALLHACFWHFLVDYCRKMLMFMELHDCPCRISSEKRDSLLFTKLKAPLQDHPRLQKPARQQEDTQQEPPQQGETQQKAPEASLFEKIKTKCRKFFICFGLLVVNITVVVLANVGYLSLFTSNNKALQYLATPIITIFNLAWAWLCSVCINRLIAYMDKHINKDAKGGVLTTLVVLALFNEIVVPCLVVMAGSSSCFYNVFVPNSSTTSIFTYQECGAYDRTGCLYDVTSVTVSGLQPPFRYNYQCGARIVTYYAPNIAVSACVQSALAVVRYLSPILLDMFPVKDGCVHKFIVGCLPLILIPIDPSKETINRPTWCAYFDARALLVRLFTNLGVIMTFGAVFPPLAMSMCITLMVIHSFAMLELKRFLEAVDQLPKRLEYYKVLNDEECHNVGSNNMLLRSMRAVVFLSCCFYALFLFDTLGDSLGFERSIWVVGVMPVIAVCLYCIMDRNLMPGILKVERNLPEPVKEGKIINPAEVDMVELVSPRLGTIVEGSTGSETESPLHTPKEEDGDEGEGVTKTLDSGKASGLFKV